MSLTTPVLPPTLVFELSLTQLMLEEAPPAARPVSELTLEKDIAPEVGVVIFIPF
jgi:hypothetical protein